MPREIRPGIRRLFSLGLHRAESARAEADEEMRFHLEARVEQLQRTGLSPADARAEAMLRFAASGALTVAHRQLQQSAVRRERAVAWRERLYEIVSDARYAVRSLARRPGFTVLAILTLGIGIGANTAIFSAVYAMLLRPLPLREPDRLMEIALTEPATAEGPLLVAKGGPGLGLAPWSWPKFVFFREQQRSFKDVALWGEDRFTITEGEAERVYGESISSRYLAVLGVTPAVGADLPRDLDAHAGAPRLALISHALWSRRYNADPAVVGRSMSVDGEPFQVIGVLPPTFKGLSGRAELLIPISTRSAEDLSQSWSLEFTQVGRVAPDVAPAQAAAEARLLGRQIYEATPMKEMHSTAKGAWGATARSLDDTRVSPAIRRSLLVLSGAVGFVLLIACVNLASLLLGRAESRREEIAIRIATGAGRGRLIRLLLTESMLLALLGGVASVGVAWLGTRILSAVNPQATLQAQQMAGLGIVSFSSIHLDVAALLFTLAVSIVVGVLFGLAPAILATRSSLQLQLKSGSLAPVGSGRLRVVTSRRVLVVAEIALAMVLLAGAGLMIRSLENRIRVDPGFDGTRLLTVRLNISPSETPRDSMAGFYAELLARLRATPGVEDVSLADCPPLSGGCNGTIITFPDRPQVKGAPESKIGVHFVSPGWFRTMRVPLVRGRMLTDADRLGAPKVILVSESAARRFWPGGDPLGTRAGIWQGGFHEGATVVGIVGDVRFETIDSLPVPDAYLSYEQSPRSNMMIFAKTRGDAAAMTGAIRDAVREVSPRYPAYDARTMESRVGTASAQARLSAILFALFATMALALAVIGIYGVMSFAVAQRTREIGIRMALGAGGSRVLAMVVREGLGLAGVGVVLGVAAALAMSRVLRAFLFGVEAADPVTYAAIVALLVVSAVVASVIPGRRAARVHPTEALRGG